MSTKLLVIVCFFMISADLVPGAPQKKRAALTRAEIVEAERRLAELGYWTGPVDGRLDEGTSSALIAFQKWEGREITG
jgi:peptidoglycan hydrolase-like protein with peptidoglycan-binding domain